MIKECDFIWSNLTRFNFLQSFWPSSSPPGLKVIPFSSKLSIKQLLLFHKVAYCVLPNSTLTLRIIWASALQFLMVAVCKSDTQSRVNARYNKSSHNTQIYYFWNCICQNFCRTSVRVEFSNFHTVCAREKSISIFFVKSPQRNILFVFPAFFTLATPNSNARYFI